VWRMKKGGGHCDFTPFGVSALIFFQCLDTFALVGGADNDRPENDGPSEIEWNRIWSCCQVMLPPALRTLDWK